MKTSLSIILPTRERADYLEHSVRTCLTSSRVDIEVLVLDNASTDHTSKVIDSIGDSRVKGHRSERRLSMRDNFERGLSLAQGDVVCFIGDDDGLMPDAPEKALEIFDRYGVEAVSAARAHYFWPDLLASSRNIALLPRKSGVEVFESRSSLKTLLSHLDYYRLPCLYHGFVKTSTLRNIISRHDRFFLSSQVDIFSAIALSAEGIRYAYCASPLVINGGSKRSNGASHFGGADSKEKNLWKVEDDLGFLPGFESYVTLDALIIESALRFCQANKDRFHGLEDLFEPEQIERSLALEVQLRTAEGRNSDSCRTMIESVKMRPSVGVSRPANKKHIDRLTYLIKAYLRTRPIDMSKKGVVNIFDAAQHLQNLLVERRTGVFSEPWDQLTAAMRKSRG